MWYPEATLPCISYSLTSPVTFTWMTCVSLPAAAGRLHRHLLRQPQQRLLLLQLQRRHLGRHPRLGLSRRQGLVRLRRPDRRPLVANSNLDGTRERASRVPQPRRKSGFTRYFVSQGNACVRALPMFGVRRSRYIRSTALNRSTLQPV